MLFLIKWYHLTWVALPLSHCSVKITTVQNHLVILFSWLKCLYSFIFYRVKFHFNERKRVSFPTQIIICPHIPIMVRAQFHWIQQQHISLDPHVRRKPKVDTQPPEITEKVFLRAFQSQSSLGEKETSHALPSQLPHICRSSWYEGSSLSSFQSIRSGCFKLIFYVFSLEKKKVYHEKLWSSLLLCSF